VLDSVDICQSVWANFFVRAAGDDEMPADPAHLVNLLTTMARHKLISHARKHQAACRDGRRTVASEADAYEFVDPEPSPSRQVALQELVGEVQRRLLPRERELQELRQQNLSWEEIAERLGDSAVALRKKWSRAMDRVARELGLEPDDE
jgi:RNA polymerase sigma factor (sigma-70 family)